MADRKQFRRYENAKDFRSEAKLKIGDYDSIMGRTKQEFIEVRKTGIKCRAFLSAKNKTLEIIEITRTCWNHLFKHPTKRRSKTEKLERALCWPYAIKLLEKTTTYQGFSREKDRGGNRYDAFEIVGYVRGCRIKIVIKKQGGYTNTKKTLLSFYQLSGAPIKKGEPPPDSID
ncbi:MAG: hypothetical protein ABIH35_04875 [Patescibacteria group bacterium]